MSTAEKIRDPERLRQHVLDLAPWYFDIEVTEGLRTGLYVDAPERPGTTRIDVRIVDLMDGTMTPAEAFVPTDRAAGAVPHVSLLDPREDFLRTLRAVYPNGLEGRSVLDCACNAGAYLFWSKEVGAGRCFGFDLREQWIEQARFLAAHRDAPTGDMTFAVSDLYDAPKLGLDRFDIVLFNGILYHLPDPIRGLQIAADLAGELLVIDTVARRAPPSPALEAMEQPRTHVHSGVYGLRWLPIGPEVIFRLLGWMGFGAVRCTWWRPRASVRDRIEIVAGRDPRSLDALDASLGEGVERVRAIVATSVPPNADVLVASGGDDALIELEQRRGWHFPQGAAPVSAEHAIGQLERLREAGADYFVVPLERPSGLESHEGFMELARSRFQVIARDHACVIFALTEADRGPFRPPL
jgi:SAM-dependent methyltransferase